ncbi:MAG TPA: hypothetical protein VMI06_13410 [Terriglobia bacterium]|nr:hypothetical protein [Terriglobia bacterium]
MPEPQSDFLALLGTLAKHHVDFIVVGGVAAVLQGAPIATFDLDVVHSRSSENIDRVLKALDDLSASYRTAAGLKLSSPGHQLLMTRFGPLDLLGLIGKGRGYHELLPDSSIIRVDPKLAVRILDLGMVIRTKEEAGHEKDAAGLAILRRTLEEKNLRRSCGR